MTTISGKQEGISNTDTKHSTDLVSDSEKSKKGEGGPETAKSKGTISPNRPMVCFTDVTNFHLNALTP
jgi:hypothetical protein